MELEKEQNYRKSLLYKRSSNDLESELQDFTKFAMTNLDRIDYEKKMYLFNESFWAGVYLNKMGELNAFKSKKFSKAWYFFSAWFIFVNSLLPWVTYDSFVKGFQKTYFNETVEFSDFYLRWIFTEGLIWSLCGFLVISIPLTIKYLKRTKKEKKISETVLKYYDTLEVQQMLNEYENFKRSRD